MQLPQPGLSPTAARQLTEAFGSATPRERRVLLAALRYVMNGTSPRATIYDEHDLPVQLTLTSAGMIIKCNCGCVATLAA